MRRHLATLLVLIARLLYKEAGIKVEVIASVGLSTLVETVDWVESQISATLTTKITDVSYTIQPHNNCGLFYVYLSEGQVCVEYWRGSIVVKPASWQDIALLPLIEDHVLAAWF